MRVRECLVGMALTLCFCTGTAGANSVHYVTRAGGPPSATANRGSRLGFWSRDLISADGRYVVVTSSASNLVAGAPGSGTGGQIFLRDRVAGTTVLVSRSAADPLVACNGLSLAPEISADGRYVAFLSLGTDLVAGQSDANSDWDLFVFDRVAGTSTLVSRAAGTSTTTGDDGVSQNGHALSADGNWIALASDADNLVAGQGASFLPQVFLFDRTAETMTLVSHAAAGATTPGNGASDEPTLSSDGTFLSYHSTAPNLVAGQTDSSSSFDVFLWERTGGQTLLVSRSTASPTTAGNQASHSAVISADGSHVAFVSQATDLVAGQSGPAAQNVFLFRRSDESMGLVSHAAAGAQQGGNGESTNPSINQNGSYVAFESAAGDLVAPSGAALSLPQVFLFQRSDASIIRVNEVASARDPWINPAGDLVAYRQWTPATPAQVHLYSRTSGTRVLISRSMASPSTPGNRGSGAPVLSANSQIVAFDSEASDLVEQDFNDEADVFAYDRTAGTNALVSVAAEPASATSFYSYLPSLSEDGNFVTFASRAPNLVPGQVDTNGEDDVFVWFRGDDTIRLASRVAGTSSTAAGKSTLGLLSATGEAVLYRSSAGNLVPGQTAPASQQYVLFELASGTAALVTHAAGTPAVPSPGAPHNGPALSRDGRQAAFPGTFKALVPGQSQEGQINAFFYDRGTNAAVLMSHASGASATSGNGFTVHADLSADGRYAVFTSIANNLVPGLSDTNGATDIFLYERDSGAVTLVSRKEGVPATTANAQSHFPAISADGRWITFLSSSTDLVAGQSDGAGTQDVFLYDRMTGAMSLVSHALGSPTVGTGRADTCELNADGRFVAYNSRADTVTAGTFPSAEHIPQIYLYDRTTGENVLVTRAVSPGPYTGGNNSTSNPWMSADGGFIAFTSTASNLVAGVTDLFYTEDVFLWERSTGSTELVSRSEASPLVAAGGTAHGISADGGQILFGSASALVPEDDNGFRSDLYLYENVLPAADFHSVTLCRALDTRQPVDGPALVSGTREHFTVPGACGIPATAKAVVLNVTVAQAAGAGYLKIHAGNAASPASTINFSAGQVRSNNAVVRLSTNGDGTIAITPLVIGGGTVHVILDVMGYFGLP